MSDLSNIMACSGMQNSPYYYMHAQNNTENKLERLGVDSETQQIIMKDILVMKNLKT